MSTDAVLEQKLADHLLNKVPFQQLVQIMQIRPTEPTPIIAATFSGEFVYVLPPIKVQSRLAEIISVRYK